MSLPQEALRTYSDWRRYKPNMPQRGGLEDQPWIWKQELDVVHEAKEWAEAIHESESQMRQLTSRLEAAEDYDGELQESVDKAALHYEKVNEDHKRLIRDIRLWWRDGQYSDPEEDRKREQEAEDREFLRLIEQMGNQNPGDSGGQREGR